MIAGARSIMPHIHAMHELKWSMAGASECLTELSEALNPQIP